MRNEGSPTFPIDRWWRRSLVYGTCYLCSLGGVAARAQVDGSVADEQASDSPGISFPPAIKLAVADGGSQPAPAGAGTGFPPSVELASTDDEPPPAASSPETVKPNSNYRFSSGLLDSLAYPARPVAPAPSQWGEPEPETEQPRYVAPINLQFIRPPADALLDSFEFGVNNTFGRFGRGPYGGPGGFHFGAFRANFGVSLGASYTNTTSSDNGTRNSLPANIVSRLLPEGNRETGTGFQGLLNGYFEFQLGKAGPNPYVHGDYQFSYQYPTLEQNQDPRAQDEGTLEQRLTLIANLPYRRFVFGFGFSVATLTSPNRDVGGIADRTYITIDPSVTYIFSPRTSFEVHVTVPIRSYAGGFSSREVSTSDFLNYYVDRKLQVGVGVVTGYTETSGDAARIADAGQTFEQTIVRGTFKPSTRLEVTGTFGVEARQLVQTTKVQPLFGVGIGWSPRFGTGISLTCDHTVENSSLVDNANYNSTTVSLNFEQRLGDLVAFSIGGGYERAVYSSRVTGDRTGREDDLFTAQIGLSARLSRHTSASLGYSYARNYSDFSGFQSSRAQLLLNFDF